MPPRVYSVLVILPLALQKCKWFLNFECPWSVPSPDYEWLPVVAVWQEGPILWIILKYLYYGPHGNICVKRKRKSKATPRIDHGTLWAHEADYLKITLFLFIFVIIIFIDFFSSKCFMVKLFTVFIKIALEPELFVLILKRNSYQVSNIASYCAVCLQLHHILIKLKIVIAYIYLHCNPLVNTFSAFIH